MIDVWHDGKSGREETDVFSIKEGKALMRKLKKEGFTGIVMYVRPTDSKGNRQYYFNSSGRIKFDKDDY